MRLAIERKNDGWVLLDREGNATREVSELAFVVDRQHQFVLFPGSRDDAQKRKDRIERACGSTALSVLSLPDELSQSDANQMLVTRKVPKRILARLKKLNMDA